MNGVSPECGGEKTERNATDVMRRKRKRKAPEKELVHALEDDLNSH